MMVVVLLSLCCNLCRCCFCGSCAWCLNVLALLSDLFCLFVCFFVFVVVIESLLRCWLQCIVNFLSSQLFFNGPFFGFRLFVSCLRFCFRFGDCTGCSFIHYVGQCSATTQTKPFLRVMYREVAHMSKKFAGRLFAKKGQLDAHLQIGDSELKKSLETCLRTGMAGTCGEAQCRL